MCRKGEMKPVSVVIKIRQGRKACTLLSGYEPFGMQAEELAEEVPACCACCADDRGGEACGGRKVMVSWVRARRVEWCVTHLT